MIVLARVYQKTGFSQRQCNVQWCGLPVDKAVQK